MSEKLNLAYLILIVHFKFNQLWKNGFEAELNFKCNAGQAFVSLQVGLGYGAESDSVNLLKKHVAPSQHRRRIRRDRDQRDQILMVDTETETRII